MDMRERKTNSAAGTSQDRDAQAQQSHKLLFALVLLLVAIVVVVASDRQFWFGSNELILDSDGTEPAVATKTQPATNAAQPSQPATVAKKHLPTAKSTAPKSANLPAAAVTRTVLPPLNVDVVAGNAHPTIRQNSPQIEILNPGSSASVSATTNAVEREPITAETQPQASYPLLAQHMNVQGSVVLQAIIGADGVIQNIHVLSGPAILAAAAQQAVREWRFKPVVHDGQAVETMAKIIVNFAIKVSDNSDKTTLAESRPDRILILTR